MASKSKFFRVAVEGATATDGRKIERQQIVEMAAGYNPATYGARVNMEHIRGFSAEAPFNAYGDVLAVKAEEVTIQLNGKPEKRMALFAEIEPTEALIKLNKARQKIYTSIELAPNFAATGKAGLVGLAVTDTPASLGTEILAFSATSGNAAATQLKAAFDARKQDPANIFSATEETSIEILDEVADKPSALEQFATLLANALGGNKETPKQAEPIVAPVAPAAGDEKFAQTMQGFITAVAADRKSDKDAADVQFAALQTSITALQTTLETTQKPSTFSRPVVTGGSGKALAQY